MACLRYCDDGGSMAIKGNSMVFSSLDGVHLGHEVQSFRPEHHRRPLVLDHAVRVREGGGQNIRRKDDDKESVATGTVEYSMSFRSFLEYRLHLEDAIGAGAVDRLGVRDVEHLCEHEQDDVQRRRERSERLHDVEHFTDEDRELDLRALWKMMTPIERTSLVSAVPLRNTLTLATP